MAPTSKKFSTRYFSLALCLLVAATTNVVNAAYSDDDTQSALDEQAAANFADHMESDIMSPSTLEQIHVITRHGARTMLSKEADTLAEAGGVTLTPTGQKQLYDLGVWLKNEYGEILGNPVTGQDRSLDYYNPNLHRFESSDLDRTLTSANALAKGLFPGTTRASGAHKMEPSDPDYEKTELFESPFEVPIPIYTTGMGKNDVTLRAYTNCPTFHDRLAKDLYKSDDWKNLELMYEYLLTELAKWFPDQAVDGKIPLKDVWNVYDAIHVARTECIDAEDNDHCNAFLSQDSVRQAATALITDDFLELEELVEHVEFLKYGAGLDTDPKLGTVTAGPLLGSNLLWKILNRSKGDGDFFLYSAHFPTLLGLLATMQASTDFWRDTGGEKFFEYGSALIVEIHKSTDKGIRYFILKYKSSESEVAVNLVIKESATGVKCGADDSGMPMIPKASWCLLDEVITWADMYTLRTEEEWCKACNNQEAGVCLARKGGSRTPALDAWVANSESYGYTKAPGATTIICGLFFGGFGAGILLMGIVWWCSARRGSSTIEKSTVYKRKMKSMFDDSTSSVGNSSDEGKETPAEIEGIFSDRDMSAEKLNDKDLC